MNNAEKNAEMTEKKDDKTEYTVAENSEKSLAPVNSEVIENPNKNDTEDMVYNIDLILAKILTLDEGTYDVSKILAAYSYAEECHGDQKRRSGEPYIVHPVAVAYLLMEMYMDTDIICAALLHDVVEDTSATIDDIRARFGQDVAILVDGLTKFGEDSYYTKEEQEAETYMKIVNAMARDPRVIIIKLCDRVHNLRTIKYLPPHKQMAFAHESINIYAKIADRCGMQRVKDEIENLSLKCLDPFAYADIEGYLEADKKKYGDFITNIIEKIRNILSHSCYIKNPPEIQGRVKSIYGIYHKVYQKGIPIERVYDKYAVRVIVDTKDECYSVMGIMVAEFHPIPGRQKDYIRSPKENGYQSFHTTVIGDNGIQFEIQIRTHEMHEEAENGMAAHWKYKNSSKSLPEILSSPQFAWIKSAIEAQQSSNDKTEVVSFIKNELSSDIIPVVTPKGKVIYMPDGSTVLDFAYKVHTEIGHTANMAIVNDDIVRLDHVLEDGDRVEIIKSNDPNKGPSRSWLDVVKTPAAKSKIRLWFKNHDREENITIGRQMLEKEFKRARIKLKTDEEIEKFLSEDFKRYNCKNVLDYYASLGYGGIHISNIMPRLRERYAKLFGEEETDTSSLSPVKITRPKNAIVLDNISNLAVKYAQCCNPIQGDEIIGYLTRLHGLSIHKKNCVNYLSDLKHGTNLDRWVEVNWTSDAPSYIQTNIEVIAGDRMGLVNDITKVFLENHISMLHSSSRNLKNGNAIFEATITIFGKEQLKNIFDRLKKIKGVISVGRSGMEE